MNLPNDPAILLSVINTKLRDFYKSFDDLCEDIGAYKEEISKKLESIGYKYSLDRNAFI